MTMRALWCVILLLLPLQISAQSTGPGRQRLDRVAALARLDEAVHYFHPVVATRATAWDSAFADNAPRILDAPNSAQYGRAVARLLASVDDASTRVLNNARTIWTADWRPDSVLLVHATVGGRTDASLALKLKRARSVVIDLRSGADELPEAVLASELLSGRAEAPGQRALQYSGFPSSGFQTSGGYGIVWRALPGERFEGAATRDVPVAFLIDDQSALPPFALAIRASRQVQVVGVNATRVTTAGDSYRVSMGEGVTAIVRLAVRNSMVTVATDTTLSDGALAIEVAARRTPRALSIAPSSTEKSGVPSDAVKMPAAPTDAAWTAAYPALGYRLLAASRVWSTIHLFYPYKALMGGSWDGAFRNAIPDVERATDEVSYNKAIAAFASNIHDSHVNVIGGALYRDLFGTYPAPVSTRFIEDKLVVTAITDSGATRDGLAVGDEVLTVDGETIAARIAKRSPYVVASTPQALRARLGPDLLNSKLGQTPVTLTVRGASAQVRTLTMRYPTVRNTQSARYKRGGHIMRVLPGNVGYVDLERLSQTLVDSMFRAFANTDAIIFDMRGYPQGTAWSIAPRLNKNPEPTVGARFRRLVVISPDTSRIVDFTFEQPIPSRGGAQPYRGKTAMLIDERAISQSEHTGLFFEAANGMTFVGSPTQGANGDVTNVMLPGKLNMTFSGHDVRHADGRQLQRVGLAPKVAVSPTIAGIRAGRDEVLEAALKYLGAPGDVPADNYVEAPIATLPPEPVAEAWGAGGNSEGMRVGVDGAVAHSGSSSGHLTVPNLSRAFASISQSIRAENYRGKRVRFSAYVKTKAVVTSSSVGGAALWMRVDGGGGILAFDNMSSRAMKGTTDWQQCTIVLDIASDAAGIVIGMLMNAVGESWIDDVSIEVVGSDVPSTSIMTTPRDATRAEEQNTTYAQRPLAFTNLGFERLRQ